MAAKARSSKPSLGAVLETLEALHPPIALSERIEDPLIDHLLVAVLGWHVGEQKAREGVRALSQVFLDLNEARSSPLSELGEVLGPFTGPEHDLRKIAWDVRMALQDVWDGTHGLDLEPLRGRDPEDQRGFLKGLPNTLGGPAALIFQIALGDQALAFGPRERHLLGRLGMLPRANSPQRIRQAMERKVKPAERRRFTWLMGASAYLFSTDWDDDHPFCRLLVSVKAKEIAERERERKREEARLVAEEKRRQREEEKRRRDEEREKARREREEAKKQRAAEKKAREEARKKALAEREAQRKDEVRKKAEARKKAAAKKKADAKKKSEAKKKADAKKKAEAKKKAATKKKADAKRKSTAKKKPAVRKKTSAKKKAAAQKTAASPARKRTSSKKKASPQKKAVRKSTAKKAAARKTTASRKSTKGRKTTAARKSTARRKG